ncbi:hypothetical protein [Candidatus Nitrospira salsa]
MSQQGVGACRAQDDSQAATRFVCSLNGPPSGTAGFLGHAMPGTEDWTRTPHDLLRLDPDG